MTSPDTDEKAAREAVEAVIDLLTLCDNHHRMYLSGQLPGLNETLRDRMTEIFLAGAAHGRAQGVVDGLRWAHAKTCTLWNPNVKTCDDGLGQLEHVSGNASWSCEAPALWREIASREKEGGRG